MIPQVNAAKPDLVLIAGDLMQNAEDIGAVWPDLLKKFDAPVLIAPGNHDMGNNVTAANLERFTTLFGSAWSSVSKNGYRIIVMNSQFWYATDGSTAANSAKQAHDAWLDAEIAAAVAAGEKIILCSHIPPFENTVDESDSYFNAPKSMRTTFMDKLIANGVDYWLCGHTHTKTQHQYANANGTLNIWTAEAVCENFDGTPPGFHIFEIPEGETVATWEDIPVALPFEQYVELQYIESDGGQYIDTGYKVNPNTRIYFKFATSDIDNSLQLFGCAGSSTGPMLRVMRRKKADAIKDGICFVDMTSTWGNSASTPPATPDSEIHEIVASKDFKSYDGVEFGGGEKNPLASTINNSLYLMKWNNYSGGYPFAGKLYACQISEGEVDEMNLVPARRVSDGAVGLYDRVSGNFLENAGTGSFGAGPDKGEMTVVRAKWIGQRLTLTGKNGEVGVSLVLCWGAVDGGDDIANWTHQKVVEDELPLGDFEREYQTTDYGIKRTDFLRVFIAATKKISLVEFVETDGSKSYFDTGIKADATTAVALDFACLSSTKGNHILGCCVSSGAIPAGQTALSLGFYVQGAGTFGCCQNDGNAMDSKSTGVNWDNKRHLFESDVVARTASLDGEVKVNFEGAISHPTIGSLYVGCRDDVVNQTTTRPLTFQQVRIWSLTTKESGAVIQHLIPAIADGKGCLYDTVSRTILNNSGSGTVGCSEQVTNVVYTSYGKARAIVSVKRVTQGLAIILY